MKKQGNTGKESTKSTAWGETTALWGAPKLRDMHKLGRNQHCQIEAFFNTEVNLVQGETIILVGCYWLVENRNKAHEAPGSIQVFGLNKQILFECASPPQKKL